MRVRLKGRFSHKENFYDEIFGIRHDHQAAQRAVRSCSRGPHCPDARPAREGRRRSRQLGAAASVLVGGGATTGVVPPPINLPGSVGF